MQYVNSAPYPQYAQGYQQSPQQSKKILDIKTLKKKSSGLGFYILAYFMTMFVIEFIMIFVLSFSLMMNMDVTNIDTETLIYEVTKQLTSGPNFYYSQILAATSSAVVPGLIYLKLSKTHISESLIVKPVKPTMLIALTLMGMGVAMVSNVAANLLSSNFSSIGIDYNLDMDASSSSVFENILYVIAVALTPAFAEEFAFRGILMGTLKKYGNSFAIITSAVMFGGMHGNIIQIPFAFIIGLVFAYIDCKANSIIPSIIIHFINNFYSVMMDIIRSQSMLTTRSFYILYYSLFVGMLVLGILAFLYIMKKDKNFLSISDTSQLISLSLKEKVKCFFFNPGVITIVSIFILETIYTAVIL